MKVSHLIPHAYSGHNSSKLHNDKYVVPVLNNILKKNEKLYIC